MRPRAPQKSDADEALERAAERLLRSIGHPEMGCLAGATQEEEDASRAVADGWNAVGAAGSTPELIALRTAALNNAGRAGRLRWLQKARPGRWGAWAAAAAVVVSISLGAFAYVQTRPAPTQTVETALGERRIVTLADRSRVVLDEGSRVTITYRRRSRDLELLRGQAEFDVASDPLRPFSVISGNRRVVATGTLFTVDLLPGALTVTLLKGAVVVGRDEPNPVGAGDVVALRPNERLVVDRASGAAVKTVIGLQEVEAWKNGKLIFEGEPLDAAISRVNRYSARRVVLAAPSQAKSPVTGVFNTGDPIAFAEGVSVQLPVTMRVRGDLIELSGR